MKPLELLNINAALLDRAKTEEYAGYDPFDGLNSKYFKPLPIYKSRFLRLAWIQFHKRFPLNLRPMLGVPKKRNPKGVALFIMGLLEDYKRTQEQSFLDEAKILGRWLINERCDSSVWKNSCWAYHFDWESRAFFVPQTTPNIIITIYVSRALYELGIISETAEFCDIALDSSNFIINNLVIESEGKKVFGYIPGEEVLVHNANLWGAAWVAFVAQRKNDNAMMELAVNAANTSAHSQRIDGSWVYGTRSHHQFVDGFHTGFNLEALGIIRDELNINDYDLIIEKGLRYYRNNFFLQDGTCKYYNNNAFPYDMHSVSQALVTFIKLSDSPADKELMKKIIDWSISEMYIAKERRFRYQKTRWYSNNNDYTRWTQAWSYYGFAYYNNKERSMTSNAELKKK